jgi:hypothetical protein
MRTAAGTHPGGFCSGVRKMCHKRVVVTRYCGPEVITTIQEDLPISKAGEARVKVLAAGDSLPDVLAFFALAVAIATSLTESIENSWR